MRREKRLSNKLMATLLSMAMLLTTILPGMPVYAAEAGIEADSDGTLSATDSDDEVSDETSDENVSDSEITDENVSDSEITDENVSDSEITDEDVSDSETQDENVSDSETSEETDEEITGDEADSWETSDEEAIMSLDTKVSAVTATEFSNVGGWNESIYAEIKGVTDDDVTEVSYSGPVSGKLEDDDFEYLVRDITDNKNKSTGEGVRIDIPGLKPGTYTLTVKVGGSTLTKGGIEVTAYDRSGYAHFNYTEGVGAYNDDGTLKKNAIVIYVTDDNKNSVKIPYNNDKTEGIGKIFSSSSNIVRTLAQNNIPLVVRFVGTVSETGLYERGEYDTRYGDRKINGLSAFSTEYKEDKGEWDGDNGHMAYIHSFKDLTIEGIGYDATIDGWGFQAVAKSDYPKFGKSFEVRNLTFINTPEDAVGMEGQQSGSTITQGIERCWIHNISCYCPNIKNAAADDKKEGDGSVDFKKGQYLTCSYNFFEGSHKTHLVGGGDDHLQYNLTYHHNYWYMCNSRGPLSRSANIHMYNNFVDMQRDYAQNVRAGAYIFSEYNLFYASRGAQNIDTKTAGNAIKSYNDSFSSIIWNYPKGTVVTNKSDYVENGCQYAAAGIKYDKFDVDPSLSYIPGNDYQLQTDFTELRKVIVSQNGVQKRYPKSITDVIESDYSVIERREDATVKTIDSLPYQAPSSFTASGTGYAFKVNEAFDLEIEYADSSKLGILVNAAGENLLEGNGSVKSLQAGTYMIQSSNDFTQAKYSTEEGKGTPAVFKDITISSFKITEGSEVKAYTLNFDSNDGSVVEPVTIYSNQRYEIKQVSTRDGYDFAGWYDAKEGGNRVSNIDGSTLTGNITLYAHWNKQGTPYTLSLDCSKDFDDKYVVGNPDADDNGWNITEPDTINGFTLHVTSGKSESGTKYYMTIKNQNPKYLATNGVILNGDDDKNIPGNEDGLLKSIEFTAKGSGVLTVETSLSSSVSDDSKYELVLSRKVSDGSLEEVNRYTFENKTANTKRTVSLRFDEAGTYYLYPEGKKGVYYYTLNVQGVEDEEVKQPEEYTVKFEAGEGTLSAGAESSITALAGANVSLPVCTPPTGKTFTGWSVVNSTGIYTDTYTVNAADADENNEITLSAVYTDNGSQDGKKYTVTFDYADSSTVSSISFKDSGYTLENNMISVSEGSAVSFKPEPVSGYKIASVKTGSTSAEASDEITADGAGYYVITVSSDMVVVISTDKIKEDEEENNQDDKTGIRIEGLEGPFYYTGAKIIPNITVKDYDVKGVKGGKILTPGVDYTVKYTNNVKATADPTNKAGKAKVTVTGKGNYTGKDSEETFEILYADNYEGASEELLDLKGAKIDKIAPVTYRGGDWYPAFTLVRNGTPTLYMYSYDREVYETKAGDAIKANVAFSNNVNKGTATLLLTGAPDSKGKATTVKKTFKINALDISTAEVTVDETKADYAVKGSTPDVKVTFKIKPDGVNEKTIELVQGIDYTVKYSSNKKAGSSIGNVVITGKGNYTKKTQPKTFTINKLNMSELPITVAAYEGVKTGKVKATVLDLQGNPLKASEYTVNVYQEDGETKYSQDKLIKGDTVVVAAEAKSNSANLEGKTEAIKLKVGANIAKAKFKIKKDSNGKTLTKTYTGNAIELSPDDLEVTMKGVSGNLTMGEDGDYVIVGYTNNIKKGTATAYIRGTGEYSGTNKVKFKIVAKTVKFVDEN